MMTLQEHMNVRRVFRHMAAQWGCPVFVVKKTIRRTIDETWARACQDPKEKAAWDRYFPNGKPTPGQYILLLGRANENGESIPELLK